MDTHGKDGIRSVEFATLVHIEQMRELLDLAKKEKEFEIRANESQQKAAEFHKKLTEPHQGGSPDGKHETPRDRRDRLLRWIQDFEMKAQKSQEELADVRKRAEPGINMTNYLELKYKEYSEEAAKAHAEYLEKKLHKSGRWQSSDRFCV